jgi:outer membrane protein OmpA-like peptidoglycan-associated protein
MNTTFNVNKGGHALTMASAAVLAALAVGCSSMSAPNAALERARTSYRSLQGDAQVAQLAPAEMSQAGEALRTADTAWNQREKQQTVDHLAYLAQQRVAIAREVAGAKSSDRAVIVAKASAADDKARGEKAAARVENDKARAETATAQRSAQDAAVELAVAKGDAQQQKARSADLEMQLKDLNAKQTERGEVVTLSGVLFDSNGNTLQPGGLRDIARLGAFLKQHPQRTAVIEGFTDSDGSEAANLQLSQRRALAVRDALVMEGVPAGRMTAFGLGEARPNATNGTAIGRQMNRRVEIVLSGEDGTVVKR